jgi:GTP cyclohydrolase I
MLISQSQSNAAADTLPDIQARPDRRGIELDSVGIEGLRIPATLVDVDGLITRTIVTVSAGVAVRASERGTHMSRLVEELQLLNGAHDLAELASLHKRLLDRSGTDSAEIHLAFLWFVWKAAPVSGARSTLDLQVHYSVSGLYHGQPHMQQGVRVPVTTLCPCSKTISRYGAHNQRTLVSLDLEVAGWLPIAHLAGLVESEASCEIYGALKRSDEKYVTERAYENPKFVEDVARDVCLRLRAEPSVLSSRIRVESQESIHNHQAFAFLEDRPGDTYGAVPRLKRGAKALSQLVASQDRKP